MRVTIEHTTTYVEKHTLYIVSCSVEFSHEEEAIIRERQLGGNIVLERKPDARMRLTKTDDEIERAVKFGQVNFHIGSVTNSDVDTYALWNPSTAKAYERELTAALKTMKAFIDDNAELEPKKTFEL